MLPDEFLTVAARETGSFLNFFLVCFYLTRLAGRKQFLSNGATEREKPFRSYFHLVETIPRMRLTS